MGPSSGQNHFSKSSILARVLTTISTRPDAGQYPKSKPDRKVTLHIDHEKFVFTRKLKNHATLRGRLAYEGMTNVPAQND